MAEVDKMDRIHGVEAIIGYQFTETSMIWEALQAAGSGVYAIGNRYLYKGNKGLAVLGDKVLDLALALAWHEAAGAPGNKLHIMERHLRLGADLDPAEYDRIRQSVADNITLDRIGRATGLVAFVNQGRSSLGVVSPITMTATVEAILAAVYLDSNMDTVQRVMNTLGLVPT